jgi:hypothetical protein
MGDRVEKGSFASPGISGALRDLVKSVARATAPRSVVERKTKLQDDEDAALGRMREGQSTDSNNNY